MTTIATDGVTIAADSQRTCGSELIDITTRKIVVEGGVVFAFTGDFGIFAPARAWYRAGRKVEEAPKASWRLLAITRDGLWSYADTLPYGEPFPYPQAYGSGANYAMAAMKLGKSPREAVALARELDIYTGGDIQVVDIAEALGLAPPSVVTGRRQVSRIDPVTGRRKIRIEETAA